MILKTSLLVLLAMAILGACSSTPEKTSLGRGPGSMAKPVIPGLPAPALALVPRAKAYTGERPAIIQHLIPGSVAEKAQFKPGDEIVNLNGERILSAGEFEQKIKHAPPRSVITVKHGTKTRSAFVTLLAQRPRFGAGFEPEGIALVKNTSPFVSFMHMRDITAFTETSINEEQTDLHMNVSLSSARPVPLAHVRYTIYDRGAKKSVASGQEKIKGLTSDAHLISKAFHRSSGFKGPILVSLDVEGKQFRFEFQ